MPLDPALVGHETQPETDTISAEAVRQFAEAIGDDSAVYRAADAARAAGFATIPAPPTFVTRFRVPFAEAGLDTEHSQVLHGEQEYTYKRPVGVGETLVVRHRIASIRQARGMALMTIEQLCDTPNGARAITGKALVIVRDIAPGEAMTAGAVGASTAASKPAKEPTGEPLPTLTKTVTQAQIDAYADVSGDHNPIHVNPDVARSVGLDGTIAHGMLSMAFAGQVLTDWLTAEPGRGRLGRLRVRFQAMVRPGDTLACRGALRPAPDEPGKPLLADVWIENQRGERVLMGDADIVG
jgi:acyl dehydratase